MNNTHRRSLLKKNHIRASVITSWDPTSNVNCKFTPSQVVKVRGTAVRRGESGRYKKYAGKVGIVVAASSRDGSTMRGDSRQFTRYFVVFPALNNKVVGLHSHYLKQS